MDDEVIRAEVQTRVDALLHDRGLEVTAHERSLIIELLGGAAMGAVEVAELLVAALRQQRSGHMDAIESIDRVMQTFQTITERLESS